MNCVFCGHTQEDHDIYHIFIPVNQLQLGVYKLEYDTGYHNIFGIYIADVRLMDYIADKEIHFGELSGKHSEVSFAPRKYTKLLTVEPELIRSLVDNKIFVGINPVNYFMESLSREEEIQDIKEYFKC